ncbi:MAG: hypothetical protein V3T92_06865 [Anaerolineae bacterium]
MKERDQRGEVSKTPGSSGLHRISFLLGSIAGIALVSLVVFGVWFSGMGSSPDTEKAQVSSALQGALQTPPLQEALQTPPPQETSETPDEACAAYLKFREVKRALIPSGVPAVYGGELDISFDAVQDAINKVRVFGPTYGQEPDKITLTGADLDRYIEIGSQISCEHCCGAKTLVREDGEAACGCAHSKMMRGLAAYLIENHPQLSDEAILEELDQWKTTYFPKQTLSAKLQEMEEAGEPGIKELMEEFPEFLPQMVGGC